tara:strand:+ start:237 stop:3293 length:3057 start_codon:yes stop_codon:yes gene_type:complete
MDALTRAFARYRQNGDLDALGRVFDSVSPRLLALALHLTGNAADAEDALQATFMVAMQKSTTFDAGQAIAPWLAGILAGEAKNLRRRQQRRSSEPLSDQSLADGIEVVDVAEQRELVAQLRTQIDVLPSEQRQVLLLQLQHGLPPAEIAEVLGIAPGTVRMRIHRGLAALRKMLPASLALSVLAMLPERGIAAVRASVMQAGAAEAAAATAAAMAVTVGGIAMKKVLLGLAAMAALSWIWWALVPPALEAPSPGTTDSLDVAVAKGVARDGAGDASERQVAGAVGSREQLATVPGNVRVTVRADEVIQVGRDVQEVSSSDGSGVVMSGVLVELWAGKLDGGPIDGRLLHAHTNTAGVAEFEQLQPGDYRLAVMAGDRRLGGPRRVTVVGDAWQEVEVHVSLGGTIRGRVVDQRGTAVAGASIWVGNRLSFVGSADRGLRTAAVSAADGTFEIHHVSHEEYVAARKVGYGASWSHPLLQYGSGEIELVLGSEAGIVSGDVVDQNGKPIAGVPVGIEPMQERLRRALDGTLLGPRLGMVVRTNAAGAFVADGLAPGAYAVQALRLPYEPAMAKPRVDAGGHARVHLVMKRRAAVFGYLRDSRGNAKSSVYVMCGGQGPGSQTLLSGPDGSYRFEGVEFEPFTLTALRLSSGARVNKKCPAPTGMDTRVDLVLDEEPPVVGHARTESGRAVAGWHVTVLLAGGEREHRKTRTRNDGSFRLWGLPPGVHQVRLHRAEDQAAEPDMIVAGSSAESVEFVISDELLPRARLTGRVVDQAGKPILSAWANLPDALILEDPEVDGEARFSFDELEPGPQDLAVGAAGYVDLRRRIDLKPKEARDLGDIVLFRGATLRVRYQRPDGRPWQVRPPVPWLQGAGREFLLIGQIDYAIEGDEVVVTRIPPGSYTVHGPLGDELLIPKQKVVLLAGEVRSLDLTVQVGRRRTLTFAGDERTLHLVVRRGDGLLVLDRKITREGDRFAFSVVLPIGTLRVEASGEGGVHFAGDIRIATDVGDAAPIAIPRTK